MIFSDSAETMIYSSEGQDIDVQVCKQGRNWRMADQYKTGAHGKKRGSVIHRLNTIVSHGSVSNGWDAALCGNRPIRGGGWQLMPANMPTTCPKCLKLQDGTSNPHTP